MTYPELRAAFREWERNCPEQHLTAHIIFTVDSFDREYPLIARTYAVSSYNKAFRPGMGGYSIFGNSLDGTDLGVRLEGYMAEEGNPGVWMVEDCYILERMRDAAAIHNLSRAEQRGWHHLLLLRGHYHPGRRNGGEREVMLNSHLRGPSGPRWLD